MGSSTEANEGNEEGDDEGTRRSYRFGPLGTAWYRINFSPGAKTGKKSVRRIVVVVCRSTTGGGPSGRAPGRLGPLEAASEKGRDMGCFGETPKCFRTGINPWDAGATPGNGALSQV